MYLFLEVPNREPDTNTTHHLIQNMFFSLLYFELQHQTPMFYQSYIYIYMISYTCIYVGTLPETNTSPLKIGLAKRKLVFQHPFSGSMSVSRRVAYNKMTLPAANSTGKPPIWHFVRPSSKTCGPAGPSRQCYLVAENLASQKREATQQRRHQMAKAAQRKNTVCAYIHMLFSLCTNQEFCG